jgi:hypothetical protein
MVKEEDKGRGFMTVHGMCCSSFRIFIGFSEKKPLIFSQKWYNKKNKKNPDEGFFFEIL